MSRASLAIAAIVALGFAGCCDDVIVARVFIGHKTLDECLRAFDGATSTPPPLALSCPGTEVTVCWASKGPKDVSLAISPDPGGQSGTYGKQGAIYLHPEASTSIKFSGGCTSTAAQIQVIDGPTPVLFDAHWDGGLCAQLSYRLDPLFVDPLIRARDVTAQWEPTVLDASGTPQVCPSPPFLSGAHFNPPQPLFLFDILQPFAVNTFSSPQQAINDWTYALHACDGKDFRCDPKASMPFEMTLLCPK